MSYQVIITNKNEVVHKAEMTARDIKSWLNENGANLYSLPILTTRNAFQTATDYFVVYAI